MKDLDLAAKIENVRDLSDLCEQWPNLQHNLSQDIIFKSDLPTGTKEAVRWLTLMADKVFAV